MRINAGRSLPVGFSILPGRRRSHLGSRCRSCLVGQKTWTRIAALEERVPEGGRGRWRTPPRGGRFSDPKLACTGSNLAEGGFDVRAAAAAAAALVPRSTCTCAPPLWKGAELGQLTAGRWARPLTATTGDVCWGGGGDREDELRRRLSSFRFPETHPPPVGGGGRRVECCGRISEVKVKTCSLSAVSPPPLACSTPHQ